MRRLAVLSVLLVALAGCGGGNDDADLPEYSPSLEPLTASAWDQKAKPERPADVKTEEGLRAYLDYLGLVTPYTLATQDASLLANLGDPATCVPCAQAADFSASYGNDIVLYEERPSLQVLTSEKDPGGDKWVVTTEIQVPASQRVDKTSGEVKSEAPQRALPVTYDVMWSDGQWELINYGPS